jgi:hypothetical protein
MTARDTAERMVNVVLALGFILLALGTLSGLFSLSQRYSLSGQAILIVFGFVLVIIGVLASRLFGKVVG